MKLRVAYIVLPLLLMILSSATVYMFNNDSVQVALTTSNQSYIAGDEIMLKFTIDGSSLPILYCNNSYSSTLIEPTKQDGLITFTIPKHISTKSGLLRWNLLQEQKSLLQGELTIAPSSQKTFMESYFGPRSILAGGNDFSMLVITPRDRYDNPVADSTQITINHQFQSVIKTDKVYTQHLIGWKNIFSYEQSGRILVNSVCNNTSSKELTTGVYPNNPKNFSISTNRVHDFADGNQITSFSTSVIKDQYNNVVSDGTHVEFAIKDANNILLKTYGSTIKGIATAKMLHPDHEDQWNVKALIPGMAESNEIQLRFKKVLSDFTVTFSEDNRKITIGPLTSFMNQLIADGFIVKLEIYNNNKLLETKVDTSFKGIVSFYLANDFYPNGNYTFVIETGGMTKKFSNKTVHD
ncbi:hypothetical protein [Tenacibaculum sp. IB213877]|uniref:hypothetical protein n=1 Tax=Tenacibaculum sp. IB213877 TaxID=3097351 RepID=UPI002A59E5C3|nr:hypothetical protein [Tenacibaculum sp. IB213877]MDY0781502.1 hypothetical protein [Tenacibaculum sp. IB213877]